MPAILLRESIMLLRLVLALIGETFCEKVWLQLAILLFLLDYGDSDAAISLLMTEKFSFLSLSGLVAKAGVCPGEAKKLGVAFC